MKAIYKYELEIGRHVLKMPTGAKLLHVSEQRGDLILWALLDTDQPIEDRHFVVLPTGQHHGVDPFTLDFIGTVLASEGLFVWHVFEDKGK